MARIAPVAPEAMAPELKELLATRPPYRIYGILANAPAALPGFVQLAGSLLTKSELDPQLREMVILRVGAHCRSAYEMHQHERLARHVGVSEERIRKAIDLRAAQGSDSLEDKLLRFTDSVVVNVKAPAEQFEEVKAALSPRQLTELLMTIGLYMMVSRVLENLEVEIEQDGVDIASRAYYPPAGS
jgi:4-carboxymuconolactone decarboxylase